MPREPKQSFPAAKIRPLWEALCELYPNEEDYSYGAYSAYLYEKIKEQYSELKIGHTVLRDLYTDLRKREPSLNLTEQVVRNLCEITGQSFQAFFPQGDWPLLGEFDLYTRPKKTEGLRLDVPQRKEDAIQLYWETKQKRFTTEYVQVCAKQFILFFQLEYAGIQDFVQLIVSFDPEQEEIQAYYPCLFISQSEGKSYSQPAFLIRHKQSSNTALLHHLFSLTEWEVPQRLQLPSFRNIQNCLHPTFSSFNRNAELSGLWACINWDKRELEHYRLQISFLHWEQQGEWGTVNFKSVSNGYKGAANIGAGNQVGMNLFNSLQKLAQLHVSLPPGSSVFKEIKLLKGSLQSTGKNRTDIRLITKALLLRLDYFPELKAHYQSAKTELTAYRLLEPSFEEEPGFLHQFLKEKGFWSQLPKDFHWFKI